MLRFFFFFFIASTLTSCALKPSLTVQGGEKIVQGSGSLESFEQLAQTVRQNFSQDWKSEVFLKQVAMMDEEHKDSLQQYDDVAQGAFIFALCNSLPRSEATKFAKNSPSAQKIIRAFHRSKGLKDEEVLNKHMLFRYIKAWDAFNRSGYANCGPEAVRYFEEKSIPGSATLLLSYKLGILMALMAR
jgi:hypothetical protein